MAMFYGAYHIFDYAISQKINPFITFLRFQPQAILDIFIVYT